MRSKISLTSSLDLSTSNVGTLGDGVLGLSQKTMGLRLCGVGGAAGAVAEGLGSALLTVCDGGLASWAMER